MSGALVVLALAGAPSALECIDAFRQRNDLALRIGRLLSREVERESLNRAEIGALRAAAAKRDRLLACRADQPL